MARGCGSDIWASIAARRSSRRSSNSSSSNAGSRSTSAASRNTSATFSRTVVNEPPAEATPPDTPPCALRRSSSSEISCRLRFAVPRISIAPAIEAAGAFPMSARPRCRSEARS